MHILLRNEKSLIAEAGGPKLKRKQENKNRKLELARRQKEETLTRIKQKKFNETWKLIPEHERRKILAEEEKIRRFELREAKINIWKKWRRKEDQNIQDDQYKNKKSLEDNWPKRS